MVKAHQRTFVFQSTEVRRCIQHALCAIQWTHWSDPKDNDETHLYESPILIIVEDVSGVYIMSGAQPRDKMRNKKIFSAYALGQDNNPKDQLRAGCKNVHLTEMHRENRDRAEVIGALYLSVGENGHCYEEIMTEAFTDFVVTITEPVDEDISVCFESRNPQIADVIAQLNLNHEEPPANTSKRRILKEETKHDNQVQVHRQA